MSKNLFVTVSNRIDPTFPVASGGVIPIKLVNGPDLNGVMAYGASLGVDSKWYYDYFGGFYGSVPDRLMNITFLACPLLPAPGNVFVPDTSSNPQGFSLYPVLGFYHRFMNSYTLNSVNCSPFSASFRISWLDYVGGSGGTADVTVTE